MSYVLIMLGILQVYDAFDTLDKVLIMSSGILGVQLLDDKL